MRTLKKNEKNEHVITYQNMIQYMQYILSISNINHPQFDPFNHTAF